MGILDVKNLSVSFKEMNDNICAVNELTFSLNKGECLAIVGESGSGKSVTAMSIMRLLGKDACIESGEILFKGRNLLKISEKEMQKIRGKKISMIFQDPMTSLNPVYTIYHQILELYRIHQGKNNYRNEIIELLKKLNITDPISILNKYPFELSGGIQQRIIIAMAFALKPEIIIADEPTTALDVSTQAEILKLLKNLTKEVGASILLITHDMGVVAEMADRVIVMYCGEKVEEREIEKFFLNPIHPYSRGLMEARPQNFDGRFHVIPGSISRVSGKPKQCVYFARCPKWEKICKEHIPKTVGVSGGKVKCFLCENIKS